VGILLVVSIVLISFDGNFNSPFPSAEQRARMEMVTITDAAYNYHDCYGSYPKGDNAAVIDQLTGNNPRKIVFLNKEKSHLNKLHELLDPKNAPYMIISTGTNFDISSADYK
jgi:hypothetical protein